MRDDNRIDPKLKNVLTDAVNWFKENDIPLYGVNVNPTQHNWTGSPKVFANIYIDDMALGIPLKLDTEMIGNTLTSIGRPYVDWVKVRELLIEKDIL